MKYNLNGVFVSNSNPSIIGTQIRLVYLITVSGMLAMRIQLLIPSLSILKQHSMHPHKRENTHMWKGRGGKYIFYFNLRPHNLLHISRALYWNWGSLKEIFNIVLFWRKAPKHTVTSAFFSMTILQKEIWQNLEN